MQYCPTALDHIHPCHTPPTDSDLRFARAFLSFQVVPELITSHGRESRYLRMITVLNETPREPDEFLFDHEGCVEPPSELPYYVSMQYTTL